MMPQDAVGSRENLPDDTRIDLRAMPPTREWLSVRSERLGAEELRAHVIHLFHASALVLGRQDLSWSVESLLALGGVADALNSHLLSSRVEDPSGARGASQLNDQIVRERVLRREQKKIQRELFQARKAAQARVAK